MSDFTTKSDNKCKDVARENEYDNIEKSKNEDETTVSKFRIIASQSIGTLSVNIIKTVTGCTTGFTTIFLAELAKENAEISVTFGELTWYSSYFFMLPVGSLVGGFVAQYIGSRFLLIISSIMFILSWLLYHWSTSSEMILCAQAIVGLASGISRTPALTYVAEITQPYLRSTFMLTSVLFYSFGEFYPVLLKGYMHWRTIVLVNLIFPIMALLILCVLPNSPQWLAIILSILNFKHGFRLCSAGEPGYLDFDNLPETNFSCQGKVIGGYYADVEAGCQMFHVCTIGQKDEIMDIKFLCLNGTVFDQETRVCERVDEVDCSKSERFYNLNLELYGNNAVTLSLHEQEDEDESTESREDQQQHHMTSVRPSTTSTTTTTTSRPSQPSTTSASNVYQQHPTGYPQHYQPRPAFPSVQTSQSNTHYDDKNGGYHHQYIFHNDERNNNNQATSYQLFSNQGVSSTTSTPQVHQQVRYSSTANPQVIHNEPSTVTPLQYHVQSTSSTIQTLLNSNANNPSIINPLFHNHGIASTTEQFNVHNNNPREITEYQDDNSEDEEDERDERRPLEAVQSTNKGKVSKLSISPVPQQENRPQVIQVKSNQVSQQQQRISINYLPTPTPIQTTINAFYPTQRSMSQKTQKSENNQPQHIHVPPPPSIPQLKPHQITINLPPPDIQRIVQNPSPLLPSQSRVIVTAKASVSDESGRPLNTSQLITLPLPTIPSNYDDYKEGDESFDPFYRDVPKIRNDRRIVISRKVETNEGSPRKKRSTEYQEKEENYPSEEVIFNAEIKDIKDLKANLPIIKAFLFGLPIPENGKSSDDVTDVNIENIDLNRTSPVTSKSRKNIVSADSVHVDSKLVNNPENIRSLITQIEEYEDKDVDVPDITEKEVHRTRTGTRTQVMKSRQQIKQQSPPAISRHRLNSTPIVVEHDAEDAEPKDTVQLFLRSVESNNSISNNGNSSVSIENLNLLNETSDVINTPSKIRQELLQTRSSSNSNKSNRRKTLRRESAEDSEEYVPRRNSRVGHLKSPAYYDEYDVSESIELGSRHRSNRLRQRPGNRRRISYREDYIDDDNIQDDEYEEESVNLNRKSTLRRGPQGRRVPYRNRNRHFDYEDDDEVDEKPRVRTKVSNSSNRSRVKTNTERFSEDVRRNPESDRRKNSRKRPLITFDELPLKDESESYKDKIFAISLKSSKNLNSQEIVEKEKDSGRSSIKTEQPNQDQEQLKQHTLDDEPFDQEQSDQIKDDYLDDKESYLDEYNESVEEISHDYADYPNSREILSKTRVSNRRDRNRLNGELKSTSKEKSHRQDKSRKFVEEPIIEKKGVTGKTEYEETESTTLLNNQESMTTNLPLDYTIPEGEITSQEYEDYNLPKTTLKIDENTDVSELTQPTTENISTEGVFKFTDELPQTDKKEVIKDQKKQKDTISVSYEDYVDDNYEPESYTDLQFNKPLSSSEKIEEQTNKRIFNSSDRSKQVESRNDKKTTDTANIKSENKDEYDEVYEDKIESTTAAFSSEEYDDLETTTETILTSTTSVPILSSTVISTSPSSVKTSVTTTPSTTTSTTISTTTSTTTTSTTTTTTSEQPTSSTTTTTTTTPIPTTMSTIRARAKTTAKYFKPTAFRKNYAYSPPSTTPNPVVIRRGQPLSGPKPTKPPPSYNELAPKPVIRRLPLLSRTTTTTSEATILESEIVAQLSKHLVEEANKDLDENNNSPNVNVSLSSLETVTTNPSSTSPSTIKSSEHLSTTTVDNIGVVKENVRIQANNQTLPSIEQKFDNEVPKQSSDSQDSNNVPQTSNESTIEMPKSDEDSSKAETTTKKVESTSKLLDIQTTTLRTLRPSERRKLELTSVKSQIQKTNPGPKRAAGFNCLEKEMYRFYGDVRDCRLFHYCSPGFTSRQVLDFRFVCEEGTIFDEESQSCRHDVPNPKCSKRTW